VCVHPENVEVECILKESKLSELRRAENGCQIEWLTLKCLCAVAIVTFGTAEFAKPCKKRCLELCLIL
jgi:hypothetical protein